MLGCPLADSIPGPRNVSFGGVDEDINHERSRVKLGLLHEAYDDRPRVTSSLAPPLTTNEHYCGTNCSHPVVSFQFRVTFGGKLNAVGV